MLPPVLRVPVPQNSELVWLQQDCRFCPQVQEQHTSFLLITSQRYMACKNIFLPCPFSSNEPIAFRWGHAFTVISKEFLIGTQWTEIMTFLTYLYTLIPYPSWCHAAEGTLLQQQWSPFWNCRAVNALFFSIHLLFPCRLYNSLYHMSEKGMRCLRSTPWSSQPVTDDYWCTYFSKLRTRGNHLEAPL